MLCGMTIAPSMPRARTIAPQAAGGASKKPVIDAQSRVTVRLQGIDAPELHYKAPALRKSRSEVTATKRAAYNAENKTERRQYWGETATLALAEKLPTYGAGEIRCAVYSFVDHPYELMDTYGRVVGNLHVGKRLGLDINRWLTEQGFAGDFDLQRRAEEVPVAQYVALAEQVAAPA